MAPIGDFRNKKMRFEPGGSLTAETFSEQSYGIDVSFILGPKVEATNNNETG